MHDHALSLLDFYRIRDDVAGYCLSEEGADAVRAALPSADPVEVADAKARASAVRELLRDSREVPSGSFMPVDAASRIICKQGSCLAVEELWALGMWASAFGGLVRWMSGARHEGLRAELESSPDLSAVSAAAFRVVGPDGEIRDLPELRDIRSRIRAINLDIERVTASFFQDELTRQMLQNDVPTQRDGRTVLAVKAGSRSRLKGIVHEVSSTGQTVYIEPETLVQRNNELVEEEARYLRELQRVLRETTAKLFNYSDAVAEARAACAAFDGLYAKARYSHLNDGVFAEERGSGIDLIKARHPILGAKAVPIDLRMPEDARTLIVTGPNTGGKTVSLKTAGLLALMNQFGLAVPAAYGTALQVFDGVCRHRRRAVDGPVAVHFLGPHALDICDRGRRDWPQPRAARRARLGHRPRGRLRYRDGPPRPVHRPWSPYDRHDPPRHPQEFRLHEGRRAERVGRLRQGHAIADLPHPDGRARREPRPRHSRQERRLGRGGRGSQALPARRAHRRVGADTRPVRQAPRTRLDARGGEA